MLDPDNSGELVIAAIAAVKKHFPKAMSRATSSFFMDWVDQLAIALTALHGFKPRNAFSVDHERLQEQSHSGVRDSETLSLGVSTIGGY